MSADKLAIPSDVVQVHLWVVPQASLVGTAAVVMLDSIRIEGFYLSVVLCYDEFYQNLSLGRQKQALQLVWVLEFPQGLHKYW